MAQRNRRFGFLGNIVSHFTRVLITISVSLSLAACNDSSEKEESSRKEDISISSRDRTTEKKVKPRKTAPPAAVSPLSSRTLNKVTRITALVKPLGQPDRLGVLLRGVKGDSSYHNYLVLCAVPAEFEKVGVIYQGRSGITKTFAKRISTLPSGFALFEFPAKDWLTPYQEGKPLAAKSFHAIKLKGEGKITEEDIAVINADQESIQKQITRTRINSLRNKDLVIRKAQTNARLEIPYSSISPVEVATAKRIEELESRSDELESSALVNSFGNLKAIRFNGEWVEINKLISSLGNSVKSIKFNLSGSPTNVQFSCSLRLNLPSKSSSYAMIIATKFELESQDSGTLQERLAKVKPIPFRGQQGDLHLNHQMKWNGQKTKLWLKVFDTQNSKNFIIDEIVLLDHAEYFSARWAKPPSPLIQIPSSRPNTPENLVKEQRSIHAKGEIRDIIPANDGSTVLIQTNKPPYWSPFDLKTGQWENIPWQATSDTLAAAQAGKVYLVDRKTKILEVWNLASSKRESLQLLQLEGTITAIAAPLLNSTQPVMVSTEENAFLLDPVKFNVIPSGLSLERFFTAEKKQQSRWVPLDFKTLCIRPSNDGSIYQILGVRSNSQKMSRTIQEIIIDHSSKVVSQTSNQASLRSSHGKHLYRGFPDHGGNAIRLTPIRSYTGQFPGSSGRLRFLDISKKQGNGDFAIIEDLPFLPEPVALSRRNQKTNANYLLFDKAIYFNSSHSVLLLPDEDNLHFIRLNLPDLPKRENPLPGFALVGETLEIPLPAGTNHTLESKNGGEIVIGANSARWTVPILGPHYHSPPLTLKWTGELGSPLSKNYPIIVHPTSQVVEVLSPDESKKIQLKRRCVISDSYFNFSDQILGFAGSGTVTLLKNRDTITAWNLFSAEMLLSIPAKNLNRIFGDADFIYTLEENRHLSSYSIQTGKLVKKVDLGSKISDITTGMSSRGNLLAVEKEGHEGYLLAIPRDNLKPHILDLPKKTRRLFFISQLKSNASGSTIWSRDVVVFRDQRTVTVKPIGHISNGTPDASGQFIVNRNQITDVSASPPKTVNVNDLPDVQKSTQCRLDESGRYIMLWKTVPEGQPQTISVRDIKKPSEELLKIRCPSMGNDQKQIPRIISDSKTLFRVSLNRSRQGVVDVYDLDIPKLLKQLSH